MVLKDRSWMQGNVCVSEGGGGLYARRKLDAVPQEDRTCWPLLCVFFFFFSLIESSGCFSSFC